jgi:hypothetical protein
LDRILGRGNKSRKKKIIASGSKIVEDTSWLESRCKGAGKMRGE